MNKFIILLIIFIIITILLLIYFYCFNKLKELKTKINNVEIKIEENLEKKLDLIINLNTSIKKVTGKKDYLKEYLEIKNYIMTSIEKDIKLSEAENLILNLTSDYKELNSNENFLNEMNNLRKIDEIIVSNKNLFNSSVIKLNNLLKIFPYNFIGKFNKIKIKNFYINKTDQTETF